MSYGRFGSEGTVLPSPLHFLSHLSELGTLSGSARVWSGRKERISAAMSMASSSSSATRQATPLRLECCSAPPRLASSSSPSTISGIMYGLRMNIWPCSAPSMTKSERPAARALTPETVPRITEMTGILPEQATNMSSSWPVAPREVTPSSTRWPSPSQMHIMGNWDFSANSATLAILRACISPIVPANTE